MANMRVYITVDTETSLGGAWRNASYAPLPLDLTVFGKCGSQCFGIPLIMDILEEFGFRATFFTEVFCSANVGIENLEKVFQCIQARGHDAQLHLHPVQRFYSSFLAGAARREVDLMFQLPLAEQGELIREGINLFQQLSGKLPRAYRAGCYGASEVTLKALKTNGIEIDSSYNLAYLGTSCGFRTECLNAPTIIEGIYEFPVTVFHPVGSAGCKPLEISAVSVAEVMTALQSLQRAGCRDIVLVLHSFSLLKNLGLRFENRRPDRIVIRRLRNLCAALWKLKGEVDVCVLGEADLSCIQIPQPQMVPTVGWLQPPMRKFVQGFNLIPWV